MIAHAHAHLVLDAHAKHEIARQLSQQRQHAHAIAKRADRDRLAVGCDAQVRECACRLQTGGGGECVPREDANRCGVIGSVDAQYAHMPIVGERVHHVGASVCQMRHMHSGQRRVRRDGAVRGRWAPDAHQLAGGSDAP